jgi:enolase-phosphatase E1
MVLALPDQSQIRVLLLDIEGTTTPVDFVYETLFPYARANFAQFLRHHALDSEVVSLVADLRTQHRLEASTPVRVEGKQAPAWSEPPLAYLYWLMEKDSKCTALKSLQGKIWQEAFARGELRGEVYPDVPVAIARWRKQGREICIYSSGSVLAQQQLFRTVSGIDLTEQIAGFFDTAIGVKTESASYERIAARLRRAPQEVLFLSDASKEVSAAKSAGMHALLCRRTGSPLLVSDLSEPAIETFDGIFPD